MECDAMKNIQQKMQPPNSPGGGLILGVAGFLSLLMIASLSYAAELPTLVLDEGANRVGLTLVNRGSADLTAVTATIDKSKLPGWLSVQCEPRTANIPQGAQARDKLFVVFTVEEAPAGAESMIPLELKDAIGNAWNYSITVKANNAKPVADALIGNYPNPFNPDTVISYSLATGRNASLVVYNALGQKVRTIVDGPHAMGKYTVRWDGKDEMGRQVSSGVYYCRMTAGRFVETRKMVFIE
jgi:hypothetical protein